MTITLPEGMIDASNLRPVPDNQELFLSPGSSDDSILIDLLESTCIPTSKKDQETTVDHGEEGGEGHGTWREVLELHFRELEEHEQFLEIMDLDEEARVVVGLLAMYGPRRLQASAHALRPDRIASSGTTNVGEEPGPWSGVFVVIMGVIRLDRVTTDIVISLNLPFYEYTHTAIGGKCLPLQCEERLNKGKEMVKGMMQSLKIQDWGLFSHAS